MVKSNPLPACLTVLLLCFIFCSLSYAEVPLEPGTRINTSLNPKTYRNYSLDIPECTSALIVSITNGTGDLDLFMRRGGPFKVESYQDMRMQSDALSDADGTADESIELSIYTTTPIQPGTWYIAPANWNEYTTSFTLSTWLEAGMPVPTEPKFFLTYDPIEEPTANIDPASAQPIGTGDIAWGGGTITVRIRTCPCIAPVDLYFAIQVSTIPDELYMLTADGSVHPYSLVGLTPWKAKVTETVDEVPFGDIHLSDLPPGTYYLYLLAAPEGTFDNFYLWSTFFDIPGAPAPTNIKPYLDQVVDDTVIDFGRLDDLRRNLGVGPATGIIPDHPNPGGNTGPQNLCTYIGGTTYLKTLPQLPAANHVNPQQYPDGMTCVYAVVADGDAEALSFRHILPEPMFGRGNIYTAIPIPEGVPAGTLIDSYETLNAYNTAVSAYANRGLLSVQPHFRRNILPEVPASPDEAPIEPLILHNPPQEFPYVIAFSQGGTSNGLPVAANQILSESPNPLDPSRPPSGRVFKVIVEEGGWGEGNARGYIWMIPVNNDFWDLRHSNGAGDPGLWVNDKRVATLTYVAQTIPIIWEAPDDPDVEQSTHDRRHVDPDAIPAGGKIQLEARVKDGASPSHQETAFAWVAYPGDGGDSSIIIDQNSGDCECVVEWDLFYLDGGAAMHFDAVSHDLNAHIELNFATETITGTFSGTLVTDYDPMWHQDYLQPFACEGSYSGQIVDGTIETYENSEGETHRRFRGDVNIHLDLTGGRTLEKYDSNRHDWVTYYSEGTENIDVVGSIRGSTESGSLRITWLKVINATVPHGFYLKWYGLSSLFE